MGHPFLHKQRKWRKSRQIYQRTLEILVDTFNIYIGREDVCIPIINTIDDTIITGEFGVCFYSLV